VNTDPSDAEIELLLAACGLKLPRELRPCGTAAAYHRHLDHGEAPCEACTVANRENGRRLRALPHTRLRPIKHGTPGGADSHRYRGEAACGACAEAYRADRRRRAAARRATA
jgi:hypothetical protein